MIVDFVINGLGNGIVLTYLDGTGSSFGNMITNLGSTAANLTTGVVGFLNQ